LVDSSSGCLRNIELGTVGLGVDDVAWGGLAATDGVDTRREGDVIRRHFNFGFSKYYKKARRAV
jgi:hypothetical protein